MTLHTPRPKPNFSLGKCEFRYETFSRNGSMTVSIDSESDSRSLRFAESLERELRKHIPFPCEQIGEATVHVIEGAERNGHLSVKMSIRHSLSAANVKIALARVRFLEGMLPTK